MVQVHNTQNLNLDAEARMVCIETILKNKKTSSNLCAATTQFYYIKIETR